MAVTVIVAEARVATDASAHHESTGFCACSNWWMIDCSARDFGFDARERLDDRHVAERVGGMFGEARMIALDRALQRLGLAQDERRQDREGDDEQDEQEPEAPVQEHGEAAGG